MEVDAHHKSLEKIHKQVADNNEHSRTSAQQLHNAKTNILPQKFIVDDYVMIRSHSKRQNKWLTQWIGPRRILQAKSTHVFVVQDLLRKKQETVQTTRMLPYHTRQGESLPSSELMKQYKYLEAEYHLSDEIPGLRKRKMSMKSELSRPVSRTWMIKIGSPWHR